MKIEFTKLDLSCCKTVAKRGDGVVLSIPTHHRPKIVPHDLAHFVIESELGLTKGFWGKVAAGAIFPGMKVVDGRQRPHAKQKSRDAMEDKGQTGTYAEVLVSALLPIALNNSDRNWHSCESKLGDIWVPPNVRAIEWTPERLKEICNALRAAKDKWQKLEIGETMRVSWEQ